MNGGHHWIDGGGRGGWFAGPEVGVRVGPIDVKAACDFVEPRDAEDGVISLTAGYNIRF